jgi:hypothetical protein
MKAFFAVAVAFTALLGASALAADEVKVTLDVSGAV